MADDSTGDSTGDELNPFAGIPMFAEMARMLQNQGPLNWDLARQFALMGSTGGKAEANVDPAARMAYDQLTPIADLAVRDVSGLETAVGGRAPVIVATTPGVWAARTLDAYRPLLTELATSLGRSGASPTGADVEALDEGEASLMAMIGGLGKLMGPSMLGMAVGSMVGQLAARAFGQYDLPIPRAAHHELLLVPATIDAFAAAWELPVDELRMWVCIQELAAHAVINVAHIRHELETLIGNHVSWFRPDPTALMDKLSGAGFDPMGGGMGVGGGMDADGAASIQRLFSDPEVLLGAVQSPEQVAQRPRLDAVLAAVVGYVDVIVDNAAARLLGNAGRISEAIRRRRIEASPDDLYVEKLFGLTLNRQQVERGKAFVNGVIERAGVDGLRKLTDRPDGLPTPAELDAPGLWLARLED